MIASLSDEYVMSLFCFQAVNNCSEFILKTLPKSKAGCTEKLASCLFWNQLTIRPVLKTRLTLPWQVTYSSAESFFENKHGFPQQQSTCASTSTAVVFSDQFSRRLLHNMLVGRPFLFGKFTQAYYFSWVIMLIRVPVSDPSLPLPSTVFQYCRQGVCHWS